MPNPKRFSRLRLFCPKSARFPQQHGHLSQTAVRHCCREMGRIAPPIGANRSTRWCNSLHPDPPVKAIPCEIKTLRSDAQTHPSWLVPVPNCRQRTASTPRHAWSVPASSAPAASRQLPHRCRPRPAPERPLSRRARGCHCGRQDRGVTPVGFWPVPVGGSGGRVFADGSERWRSGAESGEG